MPRYYCDYCDTYLTHDSPSVRKQHNAGYKHKANVRNYYQQFEEQQTQSLIDQKIKEHLGQAAAFQQVGSIYNQHLLARPRLPILPTPIIQGNPQAPPINLQLGLRPPILPQPVSPPAAGLAPTVASSPGHITSLPRLPTAVAPVTVPGSSTAIQGRPAATGGFQYVKPNTQAHPTDTVH